MSMAIRSIAKRPSRGIWLRRTDCTSGVRTYRLGLWTECVYMGIERRAHVEICAFMLMNMSEIVWALWVDEAWLGQHGTM